MRRTTVCSIVVFFSVFSYVVAQKSSLEIEPKASVAFDYPNYDMYELQLKNNTGKGIEVKVQNKATGEFVRGFGLGPLGKVEVMVEKDNQLLLTNASSKMGRVVVTVLDTNAKWPVKTSSNAISFKLINKSAKSVPLIIPNVMSPNLSPFSTSGVDLKIGQELLFKNKGKKYVLLTVDETIKEGQEIDVNQLLKDRKKELGL